MAVKGWFVYVLKCRDGSLYTGVTTDIDRRVKEHNDEKLGAKYTKVRRPVQLVYLEQAKDRSVALSREWEIKQLSKKEKLSLIDKASF